jgi:hypothetical protein
MDELDQELDMLASEKDQPVGSTPADEPYKLLSKSGCDLAIAALRTGLIEQKRSSTDQRQNQLSLTPAGRATFAELDGRSRDRIGAMLEKLPEHGQCWLVAAMEKIRQLLAAGPAPQPAYRLRSHRPGDMGWVTSRHGALYAEEYGFDLQFEALVAEIVANFIKHFNARRGAAGLPK